MDGFGRFIVIVIAVIMILLYPLQYIAQSQGETVEDIVEAKAAEFVDTCRHRGYITLDDYEHFIEDIDRTGELYNINLEVSHPVSGKELAEESEDGDLSNLAGNPEAAGLTFLATHYHNSDCYAGHNHAASGCSYHTHSGSSSTGGGCYGQANYHTHTSSCWGTGSCGGTVSAGTMGISVGYCSTCKKNVVYTSWNKWCGTCGEHYGTGSVRSCGHGGSWPSSFTCTKQVSKLNCPLSETTPISYSLNCGRSEGYNCGYSNDNNPLCATVVTSITATNPSQTIIQGVSIVTNATAAFLNGTTGTVVCTASGFNSNTVGSQVATLTYSGLVGNAKTTGTRTCTVNVTVNSAKFPTSLSVTPSSTTVYNGTEPTYSVIVNYSDNTSKTITSGYSKTGWSSGAGTKSVTFSYTENSYTVTKIVTITVLPNVASLSVTPSSTTVYNGMEPTYTITLTYENGTTKNITTGFTKTGWSSGPGSKTVTFTYTENGVTVSNSITITVKPNLTSITITPSSQNIIRYNNLSITVIAQYENNTSKTILNGYTISGLNSNILGTQTATISYTENSITKTASVTVIVNRMRITCPFCGTEYELDENDTDPGCPVCSAKVIGIVASPSNITLYKGQPLSLIVRAIYQNGKMAAVSGWTSNYDPNVIGIREVKVSYLTFTDYVTVETFAPEKTCPICGLVYSLKDDGTDPGCPVCSKSVVRINVVEAIQEIEVNQPLNITVIATYKDGHTAIITDWTSNFSADTVGAYDVTVFYQSCTDHVYVKVTDEGWIQCPICGLSYDTSESPDGCPVCSKTIVSIEASLRNGGTQVLYKSQLNLKIVLIYKDTHRAIAYTGYTVSGYQPDQLGIQEVTVYYDTFHTTLTVEVIDGPAKKICPNGHEYYLNEDGSDPGCPYCTSTDKDIAIFYFESTFTPEIITSLYKDGIYYLKEGDYLTITLVQRDLSLRSKLKGMFFKTNQGISKKKYIFGGEVS